MYYYFQAYRTAGYLGEGVVSFNHGLDLKKGFVFSFILAYYGNNEYEEYFKNLFLSLFFFKIGPLLCNIDFYIKEHWDLFRNLSSLNLSDINNWNNDSRLGDPIGYSHLKDYDYFTEKIGKELGIPPLYEYEYLNYPNPKSQLILDVCFNAYREILNNGVTFVYNLPPLESQLLGIDTIGPNPSLDGLILGNTDNFFYLKNHEYWYHNHGSYFSDSKDYHYCTVISVNRFLCDFLNLTDIHSKSIEMMRHLAWIKGRFDTLNDNPYESEKMEKGMEVKGLLIARQFIQKSYNAEQDKNIRNKKPLTLPYFDLHNPAYDESIFGYTGSYILKDNNPNDILREHLEKYQAQQHALEVQARQVALVDDQGNDNDQVVDASSLMGNLNAIDDTY